MNPVDVTQMGGEFPISRDPPEGGTGCPVRAGEVPASTFPISRDPPEGGTHDG